ncbi:MAG: zinc ribbon domain-containing protein [Lachnospiraceae bacterium]|nr:zinc ribbon domain-containing protein [Lachnospiraceae bacterium]
MFCTNCGNQLPEDAKFCTKCGAKIEAEVPNKEAEAPEKEQKTFRFSAALQPGEAAYGTFGTEVMNAVTEVIPGPWKVLISGIKQFFGSLKAVIKHPVSLIPAAILAILWLVLNLLQVNENDSAPVQVLSFLTFANGGMSGGVTGFIGGIIGKGIFAGAVTALIGSILHKRGNKRSLKDKFLGMFGVSMDTLWAYLTGFGAAMLLYLFFSGGATRISFMGGIAAAYLAAQSALNEGFLKRLFSAVTSKGKTKVGPGAATMIRGLTTGFLAAALIGLTDINLVLIILGLLLVIGGTVMVVFQAKGIVKIGGKGARAQ